MSKKIAIVILNYNGIDYLKKFLPSVIKFSSNDEIIVADNASTDDSVAFLKENFPEIRIIEIEENLGYAGGYNCALKQLDHPYYMLLNSDVEVTENWLSPLLDFMEKHPKVAAVQPKVLAYDKKTHFEHAGAAGGFLDKNYYPFCRGRIFKTVEEDTGQYDQTKRIFWASGACMLVRAKYFHEANGFDTDFFAHMEEIDLSWRWSHLGYESYCIPESKVYHVGGGTLNYESPRKTYLNFRNSLYMIYKNQPQKPMRAIYRRLLYDAPAAAMFLCTAKLKHFTAIWKAHRSFFRNLKYLKIKRKDIHHHDLPTTIVKVNLVNAYFFKKRKKFSDIVSSSNGS